MTIGERIKKRRKELNFSADDVGKKLGKNRATIYRYENGNIENLPLEILEPLAKVLQTTPSYLMGWEDVMNNHAPIITEDTTFFPVIGEVAAGYDHIVVEEWTGDLIEVPNSYLKGRDSSEFFVLRVKGDSMYPMYQDGDKVLVLKQPSANASGDVCVVIYDDEVSTLKKVEYINGEDWLRLVPINPSVPPIKIEGDRLEHCKVIGVPKLLIREV